MLVLRETHASPPENILYVPGISKKHRFRRYSSDDREAVLRDSKLNFADTALMINEQFSSMHFQVFPYCLSINYYEVFMRFYQGAWSQTRR